MKSLLHILTVPLSLRFVARQPSYMRAHGIQTTLITSPGPEIEAFEKENGVHVIKVQMERRISLAKDAWALWRLYNVIRSMKPDIVHLHTPKAGLLGSLAAWANRVPSRIYTIHGLPFTTRHGVVRAILLLCDTIACACCTQVLAVSRSMRELAIKERICAPEKIQVIGNGSSNGFDTEAYTPPSTAERCLSRERLGIPRQALVVGYVGRIVKEKGLDELVAAWADLRNEYSQLYLLVVGPEEGQDPVAQHTLRVLHSDSRIRMTGLVPNARPYLAAMDVLTLPSYREGLPNAPLEAAASGLPVVVTNVPGCTDAVLDQRTGILIPPYDSEALADALRKYLDSPALRMEHGLAGRERVRSSFAQEVVWSELLARYHR